MLNDSACENRLVEPRGASPIFSVLFYAKLMRLLGADRRLLRTQPNLLEVCTANCTSTDCIAFDI
jgi:hypothetical protein